VADLAVLCEPDNEEVDDEGGAYVKLTDNATPFKLGRLRFRRPRVRLFDGSMIRGKRKATSKAWMLTLDGKWFSCHIAVYDRALWIQDAAEPVHSGMSGSPIILLDGSAVGVVCVDSGPNPFLLANLPAWLVREALWQQPP
jgi:hypothetical protein